MSEWKTRITKVQVLKPKVSDGEGCLVLIYPPGPDMGRRWPLGTDEIVVGRGSDCDIQIDRDSVSRRHARVYRVDDQWFVEDLGSTNGSYINDVPIQRSPLRDGDFVKIGSAIFKFLYGSGIETSYHEEIYRMTIIDGLTGAHNKRFFLEFLEREMARCSRYNRPLSLLMFDIDHFKQINDTHGHLTGDYVLKELARRLLHRIRKEELLARYGGEEFAVVLPETSHETALQFAETLRRMVGSELFEYEGDRFPVTISIGVSTLDFESLSQGMAPPPQMDPLEFIREADGNLYKAKRGGRNCVIG
jgi:two-component system, cell cycle response regulator